MSWLSGLTFAISSKKPAEFESVDDAREDNNLDRTEGEHSGNIVLGHQPRHNRLVE